MAAPFEQANPHLINEACEAIGFPPSKPTEEQLLYVRRLLISGFRINTRQARYIGIHNLHSIAATLRRRGLKFTTEHKPALDPRTGELPTQPVDWLYMTAEQLADAKGNGANPEISAA